MVRIWHYFVFFLVCLVVALVLNLPAQHLLQHAQLPNTVRVAGIDGTLLSGRASQVTIERFPLDDVQYRFMPSCLPVLKLCYGIAYDRGELRAGFDLVNGDTEITDTRIDYPVADLMAYMPSPLVRPVGQLELSVSELSVLDGKPAAINGKLLWRNLGIDDEGIKLNIGDVQLEFSGNPSGYEFTVSDIDASLDVSGDGRIRAGGEYEVDIRIGSVKGMEPQVKQVLGVVAKNVGFNQYRLQQTGRLPPNLTQQLF